MHEELVKQCRGCIDSLCGECKYEHLQKPGNFVPCMNALIGEAADAIEKMQKCLDGISADNDSLCAKIEELSKQIDAVPVDGNAFIDAIIKSYEAQKWTAAEGLLPDKKAIYLVFVTNVFQKSMSAITTSFWDGYKFDVGNFTTVTHWMPLPEPPKEET